MQNDEQIESVNNSMTYASATSKWLRANNRIPHSEFSVTDMDFMILKYNDADTLKYIHIELKAGSDMWCGCRNSNKLFAQIEAHMITYNNSMLSNGTQFLTPNGKYKKLEYYGCHLLKLDGTEKQIWNDSPSNSHIYLDNRIQLSEDTLSDFLAFKLDPEIYKYGNPIDWWNRKPRIETILK